MNSNKGIFEGFPAAGGGTGQTFPSPFAAVAADQPARNPFAPVEPAAPFSPFAAAGDGEPARPLPEPGKPARLPERRRTGNESPFQVAEPSEGFGFDAPSGGFAAAPFPQASPFALASEEPAVTLQAVPMVQAYQPPPAAAPAASPFQAAPAAEPERIAPPVVEVAPAPPVAQAPAPVAAQPQPPPPAPAPLPQPPPPAMDTSFAAWAPMAPVSQAPPVAAAVVPAVPAAPLPEPSSTGIRQLELRAIFGVERELSGDEILQRLRGLSGVRNLVRVGAAELTAFENLRRCLGSLAPAGAPMRLMFGNSPVELVREGNVVLAVVTDGSFAPGVRETIMIGARELDRMP